MQEEAGIIHEGQLLFREAAGVRQEPAATVIYWTPEIQMRPFCLFLAAAVAALAPLGLAQQDGPYKVLKTARVGGEGGWDYIYADAAGRRLYIPRGATRAIPATETAPETPAVAARLTIFDLDTLKPVGEIAGVGGNGTAVDPKSGHGFTSDHPKVSMFDTKTLTLIKSIDVGAARPDGILFDAYNQRVYVFSHPTKDATVIDSKDGTVLGTIDLGGVPEQGVADGKGMLYVVMQDAVGSVTAVDVKTMKATGHYSFVDKGGCNGLALDVKNQVLFAACGRSGNPPAQPAQPMMVILSATDGKILANLPLAGGSDGASFNSSTMEAFSTHGNGTMTIVKEKSPTSFEVEQNLQTMNGARTVTFDSKTGHLFTMSQERGPAPPPPPGGGRGPQGTVVPGSFTILMIGK
jgi:DNA-binding beta-propeller fold protein YncE